MQATELLPGTFHLPLRSFHDDRGAFVKTYAVSVLKSLGVTFDLAEEFYSVSRKDVIRGMHFQVPPFAHDKIVYCLSGRALDVLVDLRRDGAYGRTASVLLDGAAPAIVFIPRGVAHGFRSLADDTVMVYKTSAEHAPDHDRGIHYASFGFDWDCAAPILSSRDAAHPDFSAFVSPFIGR